MTLTEPTLTRARPDDADPIRPLVSAAGLTKRYDRTVVLDDVDLMIMPGTVHGLLGPNGAGKTTLLAICLGLVRPDSGTLNVLGAEVRAGAGLPGRVAGFVDGPRFPPQLTGSQVLRRAADFGGRDHAVVEELVDEFGLAGLVDEPTGGYSLGQRQRLGLAAAMIDEPQVLLLDEPFNGVDPTGSARLANWLQTISRRGTAVVISSHAIDVLSALCDAVTIMKSGRVAFSGSMRELVASSPDPGLRISTSDDEAFASLARAIAGVGLEAPPPDDHERGVIIRAAPPAADALVLAAATQGIAVRELVRTESPLQTRFRELTETSR